MKEPGYATRCMGKALLSMLIVLHIEASSSGIRRKAKAFSIGLKDMNSREISVRAKWTVKENSHTQMVLSYSAHSNAICF